MFTYLGILGIAWVVNTTKKRAYCNYGQNQTAVSDTLHLLSDFQLDPRSYKNTRFPNMIWTFGYFYLSQNGNTAIPRYCNGSQYVRASFKIIMVMRYSNNTLAILWCDFTSKTCRSKTCCHHVQAYTAARRASILIIQIVWLSIVTQKSYIIVISTA